MPRNLLLCLGKHSSWAPALEAMESSGRLVPERHAGLALLDDYLEETPGFLAVVQGAGYNRASFLSAVRGSPAQRNELRTDLIAEAASLGVSITPADVDQIGRRVTRVIRRADANTEWRVNRWKNKHNANRWVVLWVTEPTDFDEDEILARNFNAVRVFLAPSPGGFKTWLAGQPNHEGTGNDHRHNRIHDLIGVDESGNFQGLLYEAAARNGWSLLNPTTDMPNA